MGNWQGVEVRHLAALAAIHEERSFRGAANRLGYVQSAVSQQIAYLERIVGRRLVERSGKPRSVSLTDAGAVLLDHIEQILEQLALAKAEIDAVTQNSDMPVSLGIATVFGTWLPKALVAGSWPYQDGEAWGRLSRGTSDELLDAVAAGQLDAAFVELPIASGPFFAIELLREPCVLVAPADTGRRWTSAEEILRRWPVVTIERCRATAALQRRLAEDGVATSSAYAVDSPSSAVPFVRARAAAAVMTMRDLPPGDDAFSIAPLADVSDRVLGLAWHRERDESPSIAALRAAARSTFPKASVEAA